MAVFLSQTVGPVVGGLMAEAVGFRTTFALGGIMYVISFALCWFFVKEDFGVPHRASGSRISETFAR